MAKQRVVVLPAHDPVPRFIGHGDIFYRRLNPILYSSRLCGWRRPDSTHVHEILTFSNYLYLKMPQDSINVWTDPRVQKLSANVRGVNYGNRQLQ